MTWNQALEYVSWVLDDALSPDHTIHDIDPATTRLVGWQLGFEPIFCAVIGTVGKPDEADAEDIAVEYLREIGFLNDQFDREADYIF